MLVCARRHRNRPTDLLKTFRPASTTNYRRVAIEHHRLHVALAVQSLSDYALMNGGPLARSLARTQSTSYVIYVQRCNEVDPRKLPHPTHPHGFRWYSSVQCSGWCISSATSPKLYCLNLKARLEHLPSSQRRQVSVASAISSISIPPYRVATGFEETASKSLRAHSVPVDPFRIHMSENHASDGGTTFRPEQGIACCKLNKYLNPSQDPSTSTSNETFIGRTKVFLFLALSHTHKL